MIRDLLASLVIATTLRKIVRSRLNNDRIVFVKGFNVSFALLLKLLRYRNIQFARAFTTMRIIVV